MAKVIIAGSRHFNNYELLKTWCDKILKDVDVTEIVSGGCRGADILGERYAKEKGYPIKRFPADWKTHKKSAAFKRNLEMAKYSDRLIAFWDSASKGTKMMIELAEKHNLDVDVIIVPDES